MKAYINHFFSLKTAPELLPFFQCGNKTSAKEITESFAMYCAAKDVLGAKPHDDILAIIIGDGSKPRTGGLLAHLTKWECHSIDPQMQMEWWDNIFRERENQGLPIQRLLVWRRKAEDCIILDAGNRRKILFFPHSHCDMEIISRYPGADVVSMPCCVPIPIKMLYKDYALKHDLRVYVDNNVWSPKNTVYVWRAV